MIANGLIKTQNNGPSPSHKVTPPPNGRLITNFRTAFAPAGPLPFGGDAESKEGLLIMKKNNIWQIVIQTLITILTAISTTVGTNALM